MDLTKVKVIFAREKVGKLFTISVSTERDLYTHLRAQVEEFLGHQDFVLNWNDGTADPAIVCRCEEDLQMALKYRQQPPSIKGMADLTLYAVNTGAAAIQDVKPSWSDESSNSSSTMSPCPCITVGCTDKAGERFSRSHRAADLVRKVASFYSRYRRIPADALEFKLHGHTDTVRRSKSIKSLQKTRGKLEFRVSWDAVHDATNSPIRIKYVNQEAKTDILRKSLFMNTTGKYLTQLYADYVDKDKETLRLIYDGVRITRTDTPATLGMEDDDVVEVHEEMIGGG